MREVIDGGQGGKSQAGGGDPMIIKHRAGVLCTALRMTRSFWRSRVERERRDRGDQPGGAGGAGAGAAAGQRVQGHLIPPPRAQLQSLLQ